MDQRSHDRAYRSAMSAAVDELGLINAEVMGLSDRMHQLDSLLEALKPFMRSVEQTAEKIVARFPTSCRRKPADRPGPIQRRINSILGLAVA